MSTRLIYIFSLIAVLGILGTSLFLQIVEGYMPCPLCTLQRIAFSAIALMFFFGLFLHRRRIANLIINFFVVIFSILGFVFAARQTWLQHFPTGDGSECGVSLNYMIQALPWSEILSKIFTGSSECSQRQWEFLSMSMPEWGVICFCLFFTVGGLLFIREMRKKNA
jgi:disulfide bond formation protein DsbB